MTTPRLDRIPRFDERSRAFSVSRQLPEAGVPRSYTWGCSVFLDQGTEGACVGHAWAHDVAASPIPRRAEATSALAMELYHRAKVVDEYAGEDYDGTSVLAGAKATKERDFIRSYAWAFTLNEALVAISRQGPAVLGIDWHDSMFEPDDQGVLHVTGTPAGGHCILAVGVNLKRGMIRLHNSWGPTWGDKGGAWLSIEDFDRLRRQNGEVCIPLERVPAPTQKGIGEPSST